MQTGNCVKEKNIYIYILTLIKSQLISVVKEQVRSHYHYQDFFSLYYIYIANLCLSSSVVLFGRMQNGTTGKVTHFVSLPLLTIGNK